MLHSKSSKISHRGKRLAGRNLAAGITAAGLLAGAGVAAAQIALPEVVEIAPLPTDAFSIGADDIGAAALPSTLWRDSDPQTLDFLLTHAPKRPASPSLGLAMRRTLLSPGAAPTGASASLGGKKLLALANAGFIDEAQSVASLATSGRRDRDVLQAGATVGLLTGDIDGACRQGSGLEAGRDAQFWVTLRALCYAQAGELDAFDLTLNLLRESGVLSPTDEAYLMAAATGAAPMDKPLPPAQTPLHYGAAKAAGLALTPSMVRGAAGGVIAALAGDPDVDPASRIVAVRQAIAMGVMDAGALKPIFADIDFDVAALGGAIDTAAARPTDPLTDALLYQSIAAMDAPEFLRDKAQRMALALRLADRFDRAYALSVLYADSIEALEGVLVAPEEASQFALSRMAVGDSVGAGQWLLAMIGANESVAALPEPLGLEFIDRVNFLAVLDPQTAARIARAAGVSLLSEEIASGGTVRSHADPAVTARVLAAAFEAVADDKIGQAGLVALAASSGGVGASGEIEAVVVDEALDAAGMAELRRRHRFERVWAESFEGGAGALSATGAGQFSDQAASRQNGAFTPRVKPRQDG